MWISGFCRAGLTVGLYDLGDLFGINYSVILWLMVRAAGSTGPPA